jgi:DNA-directed RNA polymerase subunit RPC12/RpoP
VLPDETVDNETKTGVQPPGTSTTLSSISRKLSTPGRIKCPVCSYEFPITFTETAIIEHVQMCSSPSIRDAPNVPIQPTHYECPECSEKFPVKDEEPYLHHLLHCLNENDNNL